MSTLTRSEALALVLGADYDELVRLHRHWIGHDEHGCADEDSLSAHLYDYVGECCDADAVRANGPQGSDDTGLTDPDAPAPKHDYATRNLQQALSDALRFWCAREGLPFTSADEITPRTNEQRAWLRHFIDLWEASNI